MGKCLKCKARRGLNKTELLISLCIFMRCTAFETDMWIIQEEPWKSLNMHQHNHEEWMCSRSVWQMPNVSFKKADLVPVMMTLQTEPKEHKVPTNAGCVLNLL